MSLPLMPGTNELVHGDLLRVNYRKCHTLASRDPPRASHPERDTFVMKESATSGGGSLLPASLAMDRKVLRFRAYFKEAVNESATETDRTRQVILYYFLEDNTLAVVEPRQLNSGMNQGTLIKRHKIPIDGKGRPITYTDIRLGVDISLYGKTFRVFDCDQFTRMFCEKNSHEVGESESPPEDAFGTLTKAKFEANQKREFVGGIGRLSTNKTAAAGGSSATREEVLSTTQFLQNDRKVLKFKAVWDGGYRRNFNLYFFLADGCIELIEVLPPNSGRDPFPSFVRRRKCLKADSATGSVRNSDLSFQKSDQQYYTAHDLIVGKEIYICGKAFLLYDCDAFTRNYLITTLNVPPSDLQTVNVSLPEKAAVKAVIPPHNGFGDEEDSLRSCKQLALRCPVKDIRKIVECGNLMLKFEMELVTTNQSDSMRRFVLTYYIADNTVSIFEPALRNSGILGGRFLQRQKVKIDGNRYAQAADFFVGAEVTISHRQFRVISTDERSLVYMEQQSREFDKSNIDTIMNKLQAMLKSQQSGLKEAFATADLDGSGCLNYLEFLDLVQSLNLPLVEQEIITILRYLNSGSQTSEISYSDFMSLVGGDLESRDESWEDIHSEWVKEKETEKNIAVAERVKLQETQDGKAAQGMLIFLQEYEKRRALFHQELKVICDFTEDGTISATEFKRVCRDKLRLQMTDIQLDLLCQKLFPPSLLRIPYREMIRLISNTTSYPHSTHKIARIRK
eukprot:TRINITY_DN17593_c0_g1_i1.p1 TRINITY_DN17593_c0_g1~~TRINITY_DN17593_c0_g1_i1.p1  ORF type:complete len:761 (+),score=139.87 TRINITY_DN17593_c0_g1_i1:76-2283(+)